MQLDKCRLCASASYYLASAMVLGKHMVKYFECNSCGYVQTETPYWLDEAYQEPINISDTGILKRNIGNARIVLSTLVALPKREGAVVDFAGGYGLLVRALRDMGVPALWRDQYCQNLLAKGFEYSGQETKLVTAFEVFEHFVSPLAEAREISELTPSILLSTELINGETPMPESWWYYGLDHGQHIGFFRRKSLECLAQRLGYRLFSDGHSYHLLTREKMSQRWWRFLLKLNPFMSLASRLLKRSLTEQDFKFMANRLLP